MQLEVNRKEAGYRSGTIELDIIADGSVAMAGLLGSSRSMSQPGEISIAGLLSLVYGKLEGAWVAMAPNLGMPVSKVKAVAEVVTVLGNCGEIDPHMASRIGEEEAVIDAAFIFVQQDPKF